VRQHAALRVGECEFARRSRLRQRGDTGEHLRDRRQARDALRGHPDCVREGSRVGQAAKRKIAKGYGSSGANALDAGRSGKSIAPRCLT